MGQKKMPFLKKTYLLLYNVICFCGWFYIYHIWFKSIYTRTPTGEFWNKVVPVLRVVQGFAIIEIINAILGIVHTSLPATLLQLYGRFITLYVLQSRHECIHTHYGMYCIVCAHSMIEIIRYFFYAYKLVVPKMSEGLLLTRYHIWIVLYPLGLFGEVMSLIHGLWGDLKGNVSTFEYYFWFLSLFLYIPSFPYLYLHMWKQRTKVLKKFYENKDPMGQYEEKKKDDVSKFLKED